MILIFDKHTIYGISFVKKMRKITPEMWTVSFVRTLTMHGPSYTERHIVKNYH